MLKSLKIVVAFAVILAGCAANSGGRIATTTAGVAGTVSGVAVALAPLDPSGTAAIVGAASAAIAAGATHIGQVITAAGLPAGAYPCGGETGDKSVTRAFSYADVLIYTDADGQILYTVEGKK